MENKEVFLKRWSRLKQNAAKQEITKAEAKPVSKVQDLPKPELPSVETLDFSCDFSGYMHPKVEEGLRRIALKKLFNDPHFHFENMDKLDTYIDDYSIADPIPPDMLARLMESNPLLFPPTKEQPADESQGQKSQEALPQQQPQTALKSKQETTEPNTQSDAKSKI